MAKASDKQGILIQNLVDAGFDSQTVWACLCLVEEGRQAQLLRILAHQKDALLDTVHQSQRQIDCLDFLVYQIKRGNVF